MMDWLGKLFAPLIAKQEGRPNTFIVPSGRAEKHEPCSVCGRLPYPHEDGFMIYGKPICEDCFWSDEFPPKESEGE